MDQDIRAFLYALGYNCVILFLSLAAWIWIVRPIRKDLFHPNPINNKLKFDQSFLIPISRDNDQDKPPPHWLYLLWKWDIHKFGSSDVYLYLLFIKTCAFSFSAICLVSIGIAFPVIWTARYKSPGSEPGTYRERGFYERAVITNIPSRDFKRLWILFGCVITVAVVSLSFVEKYSLNVRAEELRITALPDDHKRKRHRKSRFMPNQLSISISGIDRSLLDPSQIKKALLNFYQKYEIIAVHLVMDHSAALAAHTAFKKHLAKLVVAQKKLEDNSPPSRSMSPLWSQSAAQIRLKSRVEPFVNASDLGEPLLDDDRAEYKTPRNIKITPPRPSEQLCSDDSDSIMDSDSENIQTLKPENNAQPGPDLSIPYFARWISMERRSASSYTRRSSFLKCSRLKRDPREQITKLEAKVLSKYTILNRIKTRIPVRVSRHHNQHSRQNVGLAFVSFRHREATMFAMSHDFAYPSCPIFRMRAATPPKPGEAATPPKLSDEPPHYTPQIHSISATPRPVSSFAESEPTSRNDIARTREITSKLNHEFAPPHQFAPGSTKEDFKRTSDANQTKWNPRWHIREAPPPEDIIWENMHISTRLRFFRRIASNLCIFLAALALTSSALAADALNPFAQHVEEILSRVSFFRMTMSGFVAPLLVYLITALLLPFLVAWGANNTRFWRNSCREKAVINGNINFMTLTTIVFPIIGTTSIQGLVLFLYHNKMSSLFATLGQLVAGASGSFLSRYVLNAAFINSSFQLLQIPMFSSQRVMLKLGKTPERWNFDFGYWYAFHISLFSVCLIFSVDIPFVVPLGCLFFTAKYWVDKYNMCFQVWDASAESAGAVANTVVMYMRAFTAIFLFVMASYYVAIGIHGGSSMNSFATFSDIGIPSDRQARGIVLGGILLLTASSVLFLFLFGERIYRSIIDRHSGRVARLVWTTWTFMLRRLISWGFVSPRRDVVKPRADDTEMSENQLRLLKKAYAHPYEVDDCDRPILTAQT